MPSDSLTPEPMPEPLAGRLAGRARTLLRQRRPEEALPLLDRLERLPGEEAGAALLRAEALLGLRRAVAAEQAADTALALLAGPAPPATPPATPPAAAAPALLLRAHARQACGRLDQAIDDAAAAVMAVPADPGAKLALGNILAERGRFDEAIFFLGAAFQARPEDPLVQLRLGHAFMLAKRHEAAAELLGHCVARHPDLPGAAALEAQNRLVAGDPPGAIALARAALARGLSEAALHSVLAHALIAEADTAGAARHLQAAARLAPENPYLAHLAAALGGEAAVVPERAADAYIRTLFDGYAPRFEASLIELGYRVPGLMRRQVERLLPAVAAGTARLGPALDLGCGTGLVGAALCDLIGEALTGVDLSRRMLDEAAAKGVYSRLEEAELGAALARPRPPQALITAADVLCYFGSLERLLAACRACLAPDGLLLFNVEAAPPGAQWQLGQNGRFRHAPDYLAAALATAGLEVVEWQEEALRREADGVVEGLLVAARVARH
ncbi:methyltransferase domain-containing protein [Siccirubricoccus phaeus]|uniref:methyltransferase domain-containing protein n=1 Tax=Siccirubricoccus phaeus TaxID=2595053 RepID=UPI0011F39B62|nr:methyltransferase domain-containing protein [Siccirubricoccus phaeus]